MQHLFNKFAAQNPYNIIVETQQWVKWMYERSCGSMQGLHDYAKRYKLWRNVMADVSNSETVKAAITHLLGMEEE